LTHFYNLNAYFIDLQRYDKTYGGLVSTAGIQDSNSDFGNGYYSDHHYHYGYHVYAAAVIALKDQAFLQQYQSQIVLYIRDYANPSTNDPYFIFARMKDWFAFHSWTNGLIPFVDNRNQESTSEAINSYYAVALLGYVINNQYLADFGRLMTAMEIIGAKTYWHMPSYSNIYPPGFKANLMVGILWSNKADYTTWWVLLG
jgi:endo-1,3(4)-beta-glucanase